MPELTTEYFDKQLSKQTEELKKHSEGLQEELARMVLSGFEDVDRKLDVLEKKIDTRERVTVIEKKLVKLEEALHIKL